LPLDRDPQRRVQRETFMRTDRELTVVSIVLCNWSTIIGFGLLFAARSPVLSAIGGTVALGAFLSLVFAAILESSRAAQAGEM